MKKLTFAKPTSWFTQKELKEGQRRIFVKMVPTDKVEEWEEWSAEQYKEYMSEHKPKNFFELLKDAQKNAKK